MRDILDVSLFSQIPCSFLLVIRSYWFHLWWPYLFIPFSSCRSPQTTSVQSLVVSLLDYCSSQILMATLLLVSSSLIITPIPHVYHLGPKWKYDHVTFLFKTLLLFLISHKLKYKFLRMAYKNFSVLALTCFFGFIYPLPWPDCYSFTLTLGFSYTKILSGPQMTWSQFLSPCLFTFCSFCPEDPLCPCPLGSPIYSSNLNANNIYSMKLFLTFPGHVTSIAPCI